MSTTKAGQKAVNKYIKNHYTRIGYVIPQELGNRIKAAAAAEDMAVNTFITKAINEYMENHPHD